MRLYQLWFVSACTLAIVCCTAHFSVAQISYSVIDSLYEEDFNTLPTGPTNTNIQTHASGYTSGWLDNSVTVPGTSVGLPGWYLWHPLEESPEGGTNGHQRFRFNNGTITTASFHAFGGTGGERALGAIGGTGLADNGDDMYFGLRLVNDTAQTLSGFSILYDGEQWRRSGELGGETMSLSYSLSATESTWKDPATSFNPLLSANFTAPLVGGAGGTNGNTTGQVADISAYVTNDFSWEPGAELWLRWADTQQSGSDDGMAIDRIRFTAGNSIVDLNDVFSVTTGVTSSASTWSNSLAPLSNKTYRVVSGHTVTVDAPFPGIVLRANSGGTINFDNAGSGADIRLLVVDAGGDLTKTATGNFQLGNGSAPTLGKLELNDDVAFSIDAGAEFGLNMSLTGSGDIDFNSGAGSRLVLNTSTTQHTGVIRFNGSGDEVRIAGATNNGFGTIEMNSTGANTLYFDPGLQADEGTVIFNQPGTIDHASTQTSPSQRRLHGPQRLVANAPITVDLTKGFPDSGTPINERRLIIAGIDGTNAISGSADIAVNGTVTDLSNGTDISHHEFEVGAADESLVAPVSDYSGTITGNDYVDFEIRTSFPNGRFVMNNNSRLEMGHQVVESAYSTEIGEVVINDGGTLEIGFESTSDAGVSGHESHQLKLISSGSRNGDLTITGDNATVRMQINGTAGNQFDSIVSNGDVQLDGILNVLVNPVSSIGTNPTWTPSLGDSFEIIKVMGQTLSADFDGNGTVDNVDLTTWQSSYGVDADGDADGDGDTDGRDFLTWQRQVGQSSATGIITGMFSSLQITDPLNTLLNAGLDLQLNYIGNTSVQLLVVSAGPVSGLAAVPEPGTGIILLSLALIVGTTRHSK